MTDELSQTLTTTEARVLGVMLGGLKEDIGTLGAGLAAVNQSLRTLATIEQKSLDMSAGLDRAHTAIAELRKDTDARLKPLEHAHPSLMESSGWVKKGVILGVGMLLLALLKLVIYDPVQMQRAVRQQTQPYQSQGER